MKKILIIEDDVNFLKLIECMLKRNGDFDVYTCEDGALGIEQAKKIQPDFILMDYLMPKLDGISAMRILKNDAATSNIFIILMSANNINTYGCTFIKKPFSFENIKNVIESINFRKLA